MRCGICEHVQPVHTQWPLGPVCTPCYRRTLRNPQQCSTCGDTKALTGRSQLGALICGSCAGADTGYQCRICGRAGEQHYARTCLTCSIEKKTRELITADGTPRADLDTLPGILAHRGQPGSTLRWLIKPNTAELLRALARTDGPITHAALDACPPVRGRHYLRAILVQTGLLPVRDEQIERFETWINELVATLPAHQAALISPYAHWMVLRAARRRTRRRLYTQAAADSGRERIRTAIRLLDHLEAQGKQITDLTQPVLDQWTAGNTCRTAKIAGFIQWLNARGQTGALTVQLPRQPLPSQISSEQDHHQRIADLLSGAATVDLGTRVAGLLVLLYGAKLVQIQKLTTASITISGGLTHLTLGAHPLQLPEQLGALVNQLAEQERQSAYLFPGGQPGTHIHLVTLSRKLTEAGVPARISRNHALLNLAADIPAAVMATQLGISASAATGWAKFSQRDRGEYLRARQRDYMGKSTDAIQVASRPYRGNQHG